MGIIQRCYDPKSNVYEYYGGRGIGMADEWRHDFQAFFAAVGRRPSKNHQLDRIDNDKGYIPGNVRWVTRKEQCRNRRSNRLLTAGGITMTLVEWTERLGVARQSIHRRLKQGMSEEETLTKPFTGHR